jgi:hypothetical protein
MKIRHLITDALGALCVVAIPVAVIWIGAIVQGV